MKANLVTSNDPHKSAKLSSRIRKNCHYSTLNKSKRQSRGMRAAFSIKSMQTASCNTSANYHLSITLMFVLRTVHSSPWIRLSPSTSKRANILELGQFNTPHRTKATVRIRMTKRSRWLICTRETILQMRKVMYTISPLLVTKCRERTDLRQMKIH